MLSSSQSYKRHLPYGITQRYLPLNAGECTLS